VRDDLIARLPLGHPGADPQHHARGVRADHVVGPVVPLRQRRDRAVALEEAERRHRLEDGRPHRVVVDRRRHHRDERLAGADLGRGHLLQVQCLARVLVLGGHAVEHVDLVGADHHAAVRLRDRDAADASELRGRIGGMLRAHDRFEDVVHLGIGHRATSGSSADRVVRCVR
jgi:hypothetical protein